MKWYYNTVLSVVRPTGRGVAMSKKEKKKHEVEVLETKNEEEKVLVDMRTHILRVATDLMMKQGIKETSLKDIAKTAGISKGTLYYYYSAKNDIILDIADFNLKGITDGIFENVKDSDSVETILSTIMNKVLHANQRAKLHVHLLSQAIVGDEELAKHFQSIYDQWHHQLATILKDRLPNHDVDAFVYILVGSVNGLMMQKLISDEEYPVDAIVKEMVR